MKSKEELKSFFENGDIPKQDQFWEWQDSYWHKNEKLPLENVNYDFSNKADLVDGKVPATQLPSYVDDILEFDSLEDLPNPGEGGKIYVVTSTNTQLRWSGSEYIQIISGENVMITDAPQEIFPNGAKTFLTDSDHNSLHIKNINSEGAGITFDSNGVGQIIYNNDQFHFTNNDGTNTIPVVSKGFEKEGSNNEFYLTGGGDHVHNLTKEDAWYHSSRDFPNGTLIETDVDYSQDYGDQFLLEIKGNMYDNSMPLDAKIQGYIYLNGTNPLINVAGYTTCSYWKSITALNRNGKLCFWFPRLSYWQGFDVKLTVGYGGIGQGKNRVIGVIDSPDPTGTKRVDIYLKTLATQEFVSSKPFSNITSTQINNWDNSHEKTITDFNKTASLNGDTFTVNKQDGSIISHSFYGAGIVDTRVQGNGLNSDGSSTYMPNSSNTNLDHKVTPLFHDGSRGWQSSLLLKGWANNYKAWKITGDANPDDIERDVYISSSKSSDGTWLPERKIWTEKNFNPDTKVNAAENATTVGFQNGLSTGYPYFYHNTDGYIPLATQSWTSDSFYTKPEVDAKLSAVYRPKGSIANFASLPTTGNTEGDVWNLLDTGSNYVWTLNLNDTGVPGWDKLSETIDLTAYYTQAQIDDMLENYATLNTPQNIFSRKSFDGATDNSYSGGAIETRGNGSAIYPSIGFHQPGNYAGTISFRSNGFNFMDSSGNLLTDVNAAKFIKGGSNDNYLLRGGGDHVLMSDFALDADLVNYYNNYLGYAVNQSVLLPNGSQWIAVADSGTNFDGDLSNKTLEGTFATFNGLNSGSKDLGFSLFGRTSTGQGIYYKTWYSGNQTTWKRLIDSGDIQNYVSLNTSQTIIADKTLAPTAKLTVLGNEGNQNNIQSFNITSGTYNISSGWLNTFYGNVWKYGIARGGDSSSTEVKFGFDFSANGGTSYARMFSIDGNNGNLELSSGGIIDSYGSITLKQVTTGGHVTGQWWKNKNGSGDFIAGIGTVTNNGDYQYSYMGWGTTPWNASNCLAVGEDTLLYKGNQIWHAGNLEDYHIYGLGRNIESSTNYDINSVGNTSILGINDNTINRPFDYGSVWTHRKNANEFTQIGVNLFTGDLWSRGWSNGTGNTGWKKYVNQSDLGNYIPYTGATQNIDVNSKNIATTGNVYAGGLNSNVLVSPVLTGGSYVINTNATELYFGNSLVPTVFYQSEGGQYFFVNGSQVASINSGGLAVAGALSLNGSDVITEAQKGIANGVVPLGADIKIPSAYLPSYVDDVLEFTNLASFPTTGENGKIYVAIDTNLTYRWSGSTYIQIASGAVQSVNGQTGVVNLTKSDIGLSNVDNTSDLNKPISTATQTALNGKANALENATAIGFNGGNIPTNNGAEYPYMRYIDGSLIPLAHQGWVNNTFATISSLGNYVTTNTVQTISEDKTFDSGSTVHFTGNDQNNVLVHKTSAGTAGLVSGHDYTHYNTSWRIGNIRGNSTDSTAFGFLFSSDNGASFSNRVSIDSINGQINTAIHGNSSQWNDIAQNGIRSNTGFTVDEDYREISSSKFDIDDSTVKKFTIIFNDVANGHVVIHNPLNAQYFQLLNTSTSSSIEVEVDGYGVVDSVNAGEYANYMGFGSGHVAKLNSDGTLTVLI